MTKLAILNGFAPGCPCVALLEHDDETRTFRGHVLPGVDERDIPVQFRPAMTRTDGKIPPKMINLWISDRIPPSSRQNIGQILRAHGLTEYDKLTLLLSNDGRSIQDDFFVKTIPEGRESSFMLGRRIAKARHEAGMSQADMANVMGCSQETVSRLESGATNPTLSTLESAAKALGMKLNIDMVDEITPSKKLMSLVGIGSGPTSEDDHRRHIEARIT